ncbi:MAG: hypothetical protein EOP06_06715 [Proteobacteria bacterium]|nr:MAG: hypothetical protein EOP06_06715 [Pseudomonadota bacterium]
MKFWKVAIAPVIPVFVYLDAGRAAPANLLHRRKPHVTRRLQATPVAVRVTVVSVMAVEPVKPFIHSQAD